MHIHLFAYCPLVVSIPRLLAVTMVDEVRIGEEERKWLVYLGYYESTVGLTPPHDCKGVANVSKKTRTRRFGEPKV